MPYQILVQVPDVPCLQFSFLLTHLGGSRQWFKCWGSCHPCGNSDEILGSCLQPGPILTIENIWTVNQQSQKNLSLLSFSVTLFQINKQIIKIKYMLSMKLYICVYTSCLPRQKLLKIFRPFPRFSNLHVIEYHSIHIFFNFTDKAKIISQFLFQIRYCVLRESLLECTGLLV